MAGIELFGDRQATVRRTWSVATVILAVVLFLLGQTIVLFIGYEFFQLDLHHPNKDWPTTCVFLFSFSLGAAFIVLWVRWFERRNLSDFGFNGQGLHRYGRGLGIGFLSIIVVIGLIYILGGYQIYQSGLLLRPSLSGLIPLVILFFGFMVQGATEEIMTRGWILQNIASRHGLKIALIINMLVFSSLHAANIKASNELYLGLFNIFLVALFLGLYAFKDASLWGVCAWHCAWNWLLGTGFGLEVSGEKLPVTPLLIGLTPNPHAPWWLTGADFGPEASIVTTVSLIISILLVARLKRSADFVVKT